MFKYLSGWLKTSIGYLGQKDVVLFWNTRSAECTALEADNVARIVYNINLKVETEWQPFTYISKC